MSGAVAAHASYNGSGTQGLAVTNKISDSSSGDVTSVFWNENDTTRQLLYGSTTLEVPTSGSGKNASWGGSQIFTVNNDIDCLGDMYMSLIVEMNQPATSAPTTPESSLVVLPGGWGYQYADGASATTELHAREAASQGISFTTPATFQGRTSLNSYQLFESTQSDQSYTSMVSSMDLIDGTSGNKPSTMGPRASLNGYTTDGGSPGGTTTGQEGGTLLASILSRIDINKADESYSGGYFKKLKPGETHTTYRLDKANQISEAYQTSPPNGWAWIDDKVQIVDFNIHDLGEMVKFYNDPTTYRVYGFDTWGDDITWNAVATTGAQITAAQWETAIAAGRQPGGERMTLDDAIEAYNWYQGTVFMNLPLGGIQNRAIHGVQDLVEVGAQVTAAQPDIKNPNWDALFRSVPDQADLPPSNYLVDGWGDSTLKSRVKFPLANVIKRVEFQVGTQIWQTLEYNDLLSINATEISESSYDRLGLQTSGFVKGDGSREAPGVPSWSPGKKYQAFIPLKMLTKTLGSQLENFTQNSEDGYLMAAAPHQNVKIKVHYANFSDIWDTTNPTRAYPAYTADVIDKFQRRIGNGRFVSNAAIDWTPSATLTTKLYAQHMIMCNEEREQMKNMPNGIPKRLKMTQNVNTMMPQKIYPDQPVIIDLDHYSLYASHLIISASFIGMGGKNQKSAPSLKHAELKLNSSSFSGQLDGELLKGITNKSLGLYANDFAIDKQELDSSMGYYVFPLASRQGGGSSIPLNRFDNIRLSLTFTHEEITASGFAIPQGTINVTCVGETTGLYKNGAASLAMY